jgi:hypothetical protein
LPRTNTTNTDKHRHFKQKFCGGAGGGFSKEPPQHAAAPGCTALGSSYITYNISNSNRMHAPRARRHGKMKKNIILFLILFLGSIAFAEKAAVLPELTNPYMIAADNEKLYVAEKNTIHIYSLEDFNLVKSFGENGKGKYKFEGSILITLQPDSFFVNSWGKTSVFSKRGDFITNERKPEDLRPHVAYIPFADRFVVRNLVWEKHSNFLVRLIAIIMSQSGLPTSGFYFNINIHDADKKKLKKIFTYKHPFFAGKYIDPVNLRYSSFQVYGDRLFLDDKDGNIYVFDFDGNKRRTIRYAYEKVKITDAHKKRYMKYWVKHIPGDYERFRRRLRFPQYFPPIRNFMIADDRIYVLTFKETDGKSEMLIFTLKGELIKTVLVPLVKVTTLLPHLRNDYTINNRKLYRLVKNKEKQYELHITELDEENVTRSEGPNEKR